jgi:hypothetical protein
MVCLGLRFSAKLTLIASRDSSMLFIILLDSGSSVLTFTVAFSLAPLDRCDRLGGDELRSSSDPDEAEPLSYDPELSESLSESRKFPSSSGLPVILLSFSLILLLAPSHCLP